MFDKIIVKNYLLLFPTILIKMSHNYVRNQNFKIHMHFHEDFLNVKINKLSN